MEQQVAGLAPVAFLCRDPAVSAPQPEPPGGEQRRGSFQRMPGCEPGLVPSRVRQPGQVARRPRRRRPRRAHQPGAAGQHAPGQGGKQQQVDRGKPGSGEHIEQPKCVQHRREPAMCRVIPVDLRRISSPLRKHRPGHARQRKQEQQDQRGTHGRQLPPRPSGPDCDPGPCRPASHRSGERGRSVRPVHRAARTAGAHRFPRSGGVSPASTVRRPARRIMHSLAVDTQLLLHAVVPETATSIHLRLLGASAGGLIRMACSWSQPTSSRPAAEQAHSRRHIITTKSLISAACDADGCRHTRIG